MMSLRAAFARVNRHGGCCAFRPKQNDPLCSRTGRTKHRSDRAPRPEYLPQAHKLYERGWFDIGLTDDRVVYSLSTAGVTALELGVTLAEAREAMN